MNVRYERCLGAELFTTDGRRILDFLSGYCVHNAGHNHPDVVAALQRELAGCGPAMLQSNVPELAGNWRSGFARERADGSRRRLLQFRQRRRGDGDQFSRAYTGRTGLLYANGAFHGLTCGALVADGRSVLAGGVRSDAARHGGYPVRKPGSVGGTAVDETFAAFIVEPVQAEAGIRIPSRSICWRHSACAGATARCSCWMRFRPACIARAVPGSASFRGRAGYGHPGQGSERRTDSLRRGADHGCDLRFRL